MFQQLEINALTVTVLLLGYYNSRIWLDAAQVDSALHQNVTPRSPAWSPRITDDPVFGSIERSIADSDPAVIDTQIIAGGVSENATPTVNLSFDCF